MILVLGRSSGEGSGNPLQCSCLENPMDMRSQRVRHDWATSLHFTLFYSSLIISLCWAKASSWKRKLVYPVIFENHRSRYLELQIIITMPWCDQSPRARDPRMEVKWALGSITMNKASGGDGIPVELFQILKDNALKVLYSICQQVW